MKYTNIKQVFNEPDRSISNIVVIFQYIIIFK